METGSGRRTLNFGSSAVKNCAPWSKAIVSPLTSTGLDDEVLRRARGSLIVDVHSLPESVRDERLRARDTRDAPADDRHAGLVPGGHAGVNTPAYSDSVGRATQKRRKGQPRTNERTREHQ